MRASSSEQVSSLGLKREASDAHLFLYYDNQQEHWIEYVVIGFMREYISKTRY